MAKICYNILVCKQNHSTKTLPYYNTICKDIIRDGNDFLFISGFDKFDDIPVLKLSNKDDYNSQIDKTLHPFCHIYNNKKDWDWVYIGDDDTFINTVNLNSIINQLDKEISKEDLAVYGNIGAGWIPPGWGKINITEKNNLVLHPHGGCGFFCNIKTAKAIGYQYLIRQTRHFYFGDISLGFVIEDHNNRNDNKIKLINIPEMGICTKKIQECDLERTVSLHLKTIPEAPPIDKVYEIDYKKEGIKDIKINFEYQKYFFYDILNCLTVGL